MKKWHEGKPSEDGSVPLAEVLNALSLAADLAIGLPPEHITRSCFIAMKIAGEMELWQSERSMVYHTVQLMDAGCTAWTNYFASYIQGDELAARRDLFFFRDQRKPLEILEWLARYVAAGAPVHTRAARGVDFALHGKAFIREGFQNTCEVAARFAQRLGMSVEVQRSIACVFEQWDGRGMPAGLKGESIPLASRIANASMFLEIFHRSWGREHAIYLCQQKRGTAFSPEVVDAFRSVSSSSEFWEVLERESVLQQVVSMDPDGGTNYVDEQNLRGVALFLADFVDMKAPHLVGHSRRVASRAMGIADRLSLQQPDREDAYLGALLHDLGLVAVSSYVLDQPWEQLAQADQENYRLHPYHGERILSKLSALDRVAAIVGCHHERLDGKGYYKGLSGDQIPLGARVVAVAQTFDELTHDRPGERALGRDEALESMSAELGESFDPEILNALAEDVGSPEYSNNFKERGDGAWPAGLTDREVEIIRLVTTGMTRKEMAKSLLVSESTVRTHLEHIYNKIGVSSRAATTLFAMEHQLLL